jgi:membrane dipeptidase
MLIKRKRGAKSMNLPLVFDGHCDTPAELFRKKESLRVNTGAVSLARAEKLNGYVQFYAFCTCWQDGPEKAPEIFERALPYFERELRDHSSRISLCRNAGDAERAAAAGRCGAFLSIEGAESIRCDPSRLEAVWNRGVRMMTLTWNYRNALAGSCFTGEGLSAQGREFVRQAQALGILLDVSHLSEQAFWDLCEISEKPIVASHSNSRAVCPNPRNLTDEQFLALCRLGGTAGLNLYGPFLTQAQPTLDDVYRHYEHFLSLGGEGHVALGGDLDGCDALPAGFSGIDSYQALFGCLAGHGCSQESLDSLFHGALLGALKKA